MHFHYMTYTATPQHKNPCPGGHEIYNFGSPFLCLHNYILSLSEQCLGEQRKRFLKQIMHFHYMNFMVTHVHKNPCPRGHEIYNFGRPFLGHHYYILRLSDQCLGEETNIFKEIQQFYTYYLKITSPLDGGVMKFTISCLLTLQMLPTKFD